MACPLRMEREMGKGTYGTIYLVNTNLGLRALKVQSYLEYYDGEKKTEIYPDSRVNNLEEIDIMCRLRHPNLMPCEGIITPLQCGDIIDSNSIGLLMPLAKGDLRSIYDSNDFGFEARRRMMYGLSSALRFLHKNHYLHLDIKLENILWNGDIGNPTAILADFGLARYVDNTTISFVDDRDFITINYRSPENLAGSDVWNAVSDVWSLGILFLELLSRSEPVKAPWTVDNILRTYRTNLGDENKRTYLYAMTKLLVTPNNRERTLDLLSGMLEINPASRLTMDQVIAHPFFQGLTEPPMSLISPRAVAYTYNEYQLRVIRSILTELPKDISLGCYFMAIDLMFRAVQLGNDTKGVYYDYCIAALSLAFYLYRRYDLGAPLMELIPAQRELLAAFQGIIARPYLYEAATTLTQLNELHRYMPQIVQQYTILDVNSLFTTVIPVTTEDSKYTTVNKSNFKQGPGF